MTTFQKGSCRSARLMVALGAMAAAAPASAEMIVALQGGNSIAMIDTAKMAVISTAAVAGGATLVGIDVRPSDGKLYGVTPAGAIVTLDPVSGKWEKKSDLSEKLPTGVSYTVDFNPVADRMRLMASNGMSLRINVDDGKATVDGSHKYADGDKMKGSTAKVTAGAYVNSVAGAKETALYNIDAGSGTLVKQAPPNDGILNTVGSLGVKVDGPIAFDIASDGKGGNSAWLLANGTLYSVDLATGATKAAGAIKGLTVQVSDMAILAAK
jgi:Domain of unknown function (DUF4394)